MTEEFNSAEDFRAQLQKNAPQMPSADDYVPPVDQEISPEVQELANNLQEHSNEEVIQDEVQDESSKFDQNKVPQKRFSEEVQKRRELEAKFEEERLARVKLEAQLEAMKQFQMKEEPKYEEPSIDPLDEESHKYLESKINAIAQENEQLKSYLSQKAESEKVHKLIESYEQVFRANTPDYQNAIDHLKNAEKQAALYAFSDEASANQFISQKYETIVKNALSQGKNPSEVIYNMAKTYGYNGTVTPTKSNVSTLKQNMAKSETIPTGYKPPVSGYYSSYDQVMDPKTGKADPVKFRQALEQAGRSFQTS